jgi:RNA recognition motif-containing protein
LKSFFEEFGELESVQVQRDESNNLKDSGYVCFKNSDDAEKA